MKPASLEPHKPSKAVRRWFCYGHNGTFKGTEDDYCPKCFPGKSPRGVLDPPSEQGGA